MMHTISNCPSLLCMVQPLWSKFSLSPPTSWSYRNLLRKHCSTRYMCLAILSTTMRVVGAVCIWWGCKCRVTPPGALVRATFNMRNRFLELLTPHQCNTPLPPPSLSLPPSCLTLNVTFRNSPHLWSLSTSYQQWSSYMRPVYDPFYLLSSSFLQWAPLGPVDPIVRRGDSSKLPLLPPGPPLTWVSEWVASAGVSCCRLSAPISESLAGVGFTQQPNLLKISKIIQYAGKCVLYVPTVNVTPDSTGK